MIKRFGKFDRLALLFLYAITLLLCRGTENCDATCEFISYCDCSDSFGEYEYEITKMSNPSFQEVVGKRFIQIKDLDTLPVSNIYELYKSKVHCNVDVLSFKIGSMKVFPFNFYFMGPLTPEGMPIDKEGHKSLTGMK